MRVVTNEIDAESVRSETEGDTEFLVAPVVLVRSMELNGGYLPQREIERSASEWAGVPVPIDHPMADGEPISVEDDRATVPVVGEVRNPAAKDNGDKLTGELWVDVEAAEEAGNDGQRVVNRLQNGDAIEVSTGYAPGRVVAGQFDGEFRERAVLDISPDHLAVLPNDKGRCSLADACGAGAPVAPVANRIFVNLTDDPSGEDHGSQKDDGMTESQTPFERLGRRVADSLGIGDVDSIANDGGGNSPADDADSTSMGDKTQELVENHDFDAENLPAEDSECFDRIYNAFVGNEEGGDGDGGSDGTDDGADAQTTTDDGAGDGLDADALLDRMEDRFVTTDDLSDAVSEAITANREHEAKAEIAADIVANSDEYDNTESVLEDYPTEKALRTKREDVKPDPVANFAGQLGARDSGSSDADSFPSPIASERARELEGD